MSALKIARSKNQQISQQPENKRKKGVKAQKLVKAVRRSFINLAGIYLSLARNIQRQKYMTEMSFSSTPKFYVKWNSFKTD